MTEVILSILAPFLLMATAFFAGGIYSLLTSWQGGEDWDELIILLLLLSFSAGSLVILICGALTI